MILPSVEEHLGVEFMLSSLDEELETVQGESKPEEQPRDTVSSTRRQPVEMSSTRATRYAEVQGVVFGS